MASKPPGSRRMRICCGTEDRRGMGVKVAVGAQLALQLHEDIAAQVLGTFPQEAVQAPGGRKGANSWAPTPGDLTQPLGSSSSAASVSDPSRTSFRWRSWMGSAQSTSSRIGSSPAFSLSLPRISQ